MEERESYNGQFRDGDRVHVDKPLKDIIEAENQSVISIVLGALAVAFSTLIFGFILGIFAIKYSKPPRVVLNSRHHKYHIATIGEIAGWVSIALSIFFLILYIILAIVFVIYSKELQDFINNPRYFSY